MVRRLFRGLAIAVAILTLSGCFAWEEGHTLGVKIGTTWWGAPEATVAIFRRATLRLRQHYRNELTTPDGTNAACDQRTWLTRTQCVRADLRIAGEKLPHVGFLRDRWAAALSDDQLSDLHTAIDESAPAGRCLALYARVGAGDIGYNWTKRSNGSDTCTRGADPLPGWRPGIA